MSITFEDVAFTLPADFLPSCHSLLHYGVRTAGLAHRWLLRASIPVCP
jgi:hypothetical protein